MADQEMQVTHKKEVEANRGEFMSEGPYFAPAVDIYETEQELIVLADMPGVNSDHVEIDLRDNSLTIVGKAPLDKEEGTALLAEYRKGNYFRTFRITDVVDQTKISASFSDGVLRITLPKVAKAVPRKIPITTE